MENDDLGIPAMPEGTIGYHLAEDDAFGLKTTLMKPYPRSNEQMKDHEKVFNFRLSTARVVVENAFGIMANRVWLPLPVYVIWIK